MSTPKVKTTPPERPLFIPLKREYFEAFKAGLKQEEFRPNGPGWNERTCRIGRRVTLSLGYGARNRLTGVVSSFRLSEEVTKSPAWLACYGSNRSATAACIGIRLDS